MTVMLPSTKERDMDSSTDDDNDSDGDGVNDGKIKSETFPWGRLC